MAVEWTIFWSFCHREVSRGIWHWYGPFSRLSLPLGLLRRMVVTWIISWLSVTLKSGVDDSGGMDDYLVFLLP